VPVARRVLLVAVLALSPALAACGGADEEQQVRDTMQQFARATADKDYQALCDDLLDESLLEKLRARNLPCEVALRTGLEDVERPSLTVRSVSVDGDRASAVVRTTAANQEPSEDRVQLVRRDGEWRITALAS
jgi:hypothetical protein